MVFPIGDNEQLGTATLNLDADLSGLQKGLKEGEKATETSTGKMDKGWRGVQTRIQGAAGQIPIVGDRLAGLVTPAGAATVAFGAVSTAIVSAVNKVTQMERELRPLIERSGLTAESLQILAQTSERLGGENGLESVTEAAQELQIRLSEAVLYGTGPAVEAFDQLGLSSEDLISKSPEEMLLAVITALQNVTDETHRKFLADELLGGVQEDLNGILNLTNAEFEKQRAAVAASADIMSNEAVASAREYDENLQQLKDTAGTVQTFIGTHMVAAINDFVSATRDDLTEVRTEWEATKDTTLGTLESVTNFITGHVEPVIVDLGDGFEDMSVSILESGDSTFNPETEGSYPAIMMDGLNTAVQSNKEFLDQLETDRRESFAEQQAAERERRTQLAEKRAEHYNNMLIKRQQHSEDIEEEVEEHLDEVEVKYDRHYTDLETDTDQHFSEMGDKNDQYWIDLLQANQDAYAKRLEEQLAAYDEQEDAQDAHFKEIADSTGIHLTNIESMYAESGLAVSATWNQVMDNLTQQVHAYTATLRAAAGPQGGGFSMFEDVRHRTLRTADESELRFYEGLHGQKKAVHKETGENYIYHNGQWVSESDYHHNLYADDRRAADPIRAGDPRALTREDLGLPPVGSTPPTLPGLPGFGAGAIVTAPVFAGLGEAGTEVVLPIEKLPEIMRSIGAGGMGDPRVVVQVNEGAYVFDDFVEAVQDALHEAARGIV